MPSAGDDLPATPFSLGRLYQPVTFEDEQAIAETGFVGLMPSADGIAKLVRVLSIVAANHMEQKKLTSGD